MPEPASSRETGAAADRSLRRFFRPYLAGAIVGIVGLVVTAILVVAIPWVLQHGIDALLAGDGRKAAELSGVLALLVVLQAIGRVTSRIRVFNVGRLVEYDLRKALLAQLHRLGPAFYARMPSGEVMSRSINDLNQVRLLCGFGVLNVAHTATMYVGALALMFAIDWRLTLATTAIFPILWYVVRRFGRAMFARSFEAQQILGVLSDRVQQNLAGVRVVRSFGVEEHELRAFDVVSQEAVKRNMSLVTIRGWMFPILGLTGAFGTLIVLWYGGGLVVEGELTLGEFVAFQSYLSLLTWPTIALGFVLSILQRGRASYARLREILDAEPDIPPDPPNGGAVKHAPAEGALDVQGLSFQYGATEALQDVSFDLPAGVRLAVVGRTASGKSTLAALLARLLPTPPGKIRLDGQDVNDLPLAHVRKAIGYSPQEAFLFSTTIERNIAFALDDPSAPDAEERIRAAAAAAQVLDEIEAMPAGFDTVVGERGVQLSGGQKQRVALARALVSNPRILILDDPLSAVDAATERRILDALDAAAGNRSVVLVTHRTSAAARADRVIVLENGRVVERGTHESLAAAGGLYAAFDQRQRLERELEDL